jgi:hypothetical protein
MASSSSSGHVETCSTERVKGRVRFVGCEQWWWRRSRGVITWEREAERAEQLMMVVVVVGCDVRAPRVVACNVRLSCGRAVGVEGREEATHDERSRGVQQICRWARERGRR